MVIGTGDKTSVVNFIRQIWNRLGYVCAAIGTLDVIIWIHFVYLKIICDGSTASNRLLVKQPLHYLALQGMTHVAIEASSHALDQTRSSDIKAICIGFTFFSRDHLDYQQAMHQNIDAKLKVFAKNATDYTVVMINKELNSLLPRWVKEKEK